MAPDAEVGLEGTPKPKIQRDPPTRKPYMWAAAVRELRTGNSGGNTHYDTTPQQQPLPRALRLTWTELNCCTGVLQYKISTLSLPSA